MEPPVLRFGVALTGILSMVMGRFLDGAHRLPQIIAGLCLGISSGMLASMLIGNIVMPPVLAAAAVTLAPAYHVRKTWKTSWKMYFKAFFILAPVALAASPREADRIV